METSSDSRDNWSGMAPVSELFLSVSALHSNQAHDDNLKGVQRTEAGGSRLSTTVAYVTWLGVLPVQDTPQYVSSSEPFKHCTEGGTVRSRCTLTNRVSTMNHKRILHIHNTQSGRHSHTDRVGLDWPV